jgi:hypothetical protein
MPETSKTGQCHPRASPRFRGKKTPIDCLQKPQLIPSALELSHAIPKGLWTSMILPKIAFVSLVFHLGNAFLDPCRAQTVFSPLCHYDTRSFIANYIRSLDYFLSYRFPITP